MFVNERLVLAPRVPRRALLMCLALLASGALAGTARAEPIQLRIATPGRPDRLGYPESPAILAAYRAWAAEIEEDTGGTVEVAFVDSQGDDISALSKLRRGLLDGAVVGVPGLTALSTRFLALSTPMTFADARELSAVRDVLAPELTAALAGARIVRLAWTDRGPSLLLSRMPVVTLRDLRAARCWVNEGDPMARALYGVLNVNPVTLALPALADAVRTGNVELATLSVLTAGAQRVIPYWPQSPADRWQTSLLPSATRLSFGPELGALLLHEQALARLDDEQRAAVLSASARLEGALRAAVESEAPRTEERLREIGVTLVDPAPELVEALSRAGRAALLRTGDRAWLARIDAALAEVRSAAR